jgi:hypothetical protein
MTVPDDLFSTAKKEDPVHIHCTHSLGMPYETWIESLVRTKRCRTYGAVVTHPTLFLIDHKSFAVTENLYFALLHLRDHRIPRIF